MCVRIHVCVMSCAVIVDLSYLKPKQRDSRSPGRTTDHAHSVSGWQQYIEVWGSAFDPRRPLVWLQVASPLLLIRPKCLVYWSREKIAMNWGLVCSCFQPFVLMEKLPWYNPSLNESLTSEAFAHKSETLNLCNSSQLFQVQLHVRPLYHTHTPSCQALGSTSLFFVGFFHLFLVFSRLLYSSILVSFHVCQIVLGLSSPSAPDVSLSLFATRPLNLCFFFSHRLSLLSALLFVVMTVFCCNFTSGAQSLRLLWLCPQFDPISTWKSIRCSCPACL